MTGQTFFLSLAHRSKWNLLPDHVCYKFLTYRNLAKFTHVSRVLKTEVKRLLATEDTEDFVYICCKVSSRGRWTMTVSRADYHPNVMATDNNILFSYICSDRFAAMCRSCTGTRLFLCCNSFTYLSAVPLFWWIIARCSSYEWRFFPGTKIEEFGRAHYPARNHNREKHLAAGQLCAYLIPADSNKRPLHKAHFHITRVSFPVR